jgi:hypothetical protein
MAQHTASVATTTTLKADEWHANGKAVYIVVSLDWQGQAMLAEADSERQYAC